MRSYTRFYIWWFNRTLSIYNKFVCYRFNNCLRGGNYKLQFYHDIENWFFKQCKKLFWTNLKVKTLYWKLLHLLDKRAKLDLRLTKIQALSGSIILWIHEIGCHAIRCLKVNVCLLPLHPKPVVLQRNRKQREECSKQAKEQAAPSCDREPQASGQYWLEKFQLKVLSSPIWKMEIKHQIGHISEE